MPGAETFRASADAYDRFVGRYGLQLATALIGFASGGTRDGAGDAPFELTARAWAVAGRVRD